MKKYYLLLFVAFSTYLQAQYSYISDRRFFEPVDLLGFDFKPGAMEIPDEEERKLDPGEYSFGITLNHLYVEGEGIKGVYNINNMQPTDYGFKLLLMNARNARLQGHLKVIQNKYGMVEMLIFKRSNNEKEIIFYQLPISKQQRDTEKSYFTDRGEMVVEHKDSILGKTVHPFLIIHEKEKVQQRLQASDSMYISFIEEISIEEKEVKKKKKDKKDDLEIVADSLSFEEIEAPEKDPSIIEAPEIKIKITREYFVMVHSLITNDMGLKETLSKKYPFKKINQKEDEMAGMQEERFLLEFVNDKKKKIHLFLNGDRTVSTLEIGDKKYLMRGF